MQTTSLYIHFPWCVRKCPYCDFNSHTLKTTIPFADYFHTLQCDWRQAQAQYTINQLSSIFIGGGTPSLFPAEFFAKLFAFLQEDVDFQQAEITLEANPGTVEQAQFSGYHRAGINRLSLGIQSFSDQHLKTLGRIHDASQARQAVQTVKKAGFQNFNLDIMYGLPEQTVQQALTDLQQAIALEPSHISWYQLTLEPNTLFYKQAPKLPEHDLIWEMQQAGFALLEDNGFIQYEISAFAKGQAYCQHNLHYWRFGDYIGIGAGAHSKRTLLTPEFAIERTIKYKHPQQYLSQDQQIQKQYFVPKSEFAFEYMLNALRLKSPISFADIKNLTQLDKKDLFPALQKAQSLSLLTMNEHTFQLTEQGFNFYNDVLQLFI